MKGQVIFMTMKTKRTLAIGGGTVVCAALAILIAARFAPDEKQLTASDSEPTSATQISIEISTAKREKSDPIETEKAEIQLDSGADETIDPEEINAEFIENGGIEIKQNFPEIEAETEENEPPAPPEIADEEMLTNPDIEPIYDPEQTEYSAPENPSDTPKHGDTKDGMIYINGFGWVADEGGGGRGEAAPDMYENGNKIGYFG